MLSHTAFCYLTAHGAFFREGGDRSTDSFDQVVSTDVCTLASQVVYWCMEGGPMRGFGMYRTNVGGVLMFQHSLDLVLSRFQLC